MPSSSSIGGPSNVRRKIVWMLSAFSVLSYLLRMNISIAQQTHDPVIVVRDGTDKPATYFIYSWDEGAEQVIMAADADNFVPLQRIHAVPADSSVVYPDRDSRTG